MSEETKTQCWVCGVPESASVALGATRSGHAICGPCSSLVTQIAADQLRSKTAAKVVAGRAPDLLPICATVEDVRRAAPVAGFYPVERRLADRARAPWTVAKLDMQQESMERVWWAIHEGWYFDNELVGARIGHRIVMPGEGE